MIDQLYSLKATIEAQKSASKDSLVAQLASRTNLLTKLRERLEVNDALSPRASAVLDDLKSHEIAGVKNLVRNDFVLLFLLALYFKGIKAEVSSLCDSELESQLYYF